MISKTNEYDLSPETHNKADKLLSYIELRKKQIELIKEITETNKTDELLPQLIEARQKADDAFAEVLKL
jgi:capsid portal protein